MIWAVSLRNIWRNKIRSSIIMASIAIGIFAGVFSWAFYRGMINQRVQSAIMTESSSIQIHEPNYLQNPEQKNYIPNLSQIATRVNNIEGVQAVSNRIIVDAMAASAETGSGVKVMGIDPEIEKNVTNIYSKITEGTYFEGEASTPVVIGVYIAQKLSVKLRSRIVITLQNMDGTITSGLFRVEGIYNTSNSGFDERNVFVKRDDLAGLIGLDPSSGHELAVLLKNNEQLDAMKGIIQTDYPGLDVKTWKQLMPEVSLMQETMDFSMYIFMGIILAALIFGIVNTMLMAVLERFKELGMLMAVGLNKIRVFTMIVLETTFLSLYGGFAGIILGYVITWVLNKRGIDLSSLNLAAEKLGFESIVYPAIDPDIAIKVTIMVFITGILASIYPALKALQLKPAEALHIDV
jgi:putative ABC transport system permease protein